MRKVKILATLGPSTKGVKQLEKLLKAGCNAVRLNFSHGTHEDHIQMVSDLREAANNLDMPIPILGDLSGPKIRLGKFSCDAFNVEPGDKLTLTSKDIEGTRELLPHSYKPLSKDISIGEDILINDGLIRLKVESITDDDVNCVVEVGGTISNNKGINLPNTILSTPALTEKDIRDVELAKELQLDFLALSFVRTEKDIADLKKLCPTLPVIAKIEKPEAIEHLDAILKASDGIMIARGDLGVELGHEKVPLVQKKIIQKIRRYAKPVITATQMLESMITNATPTRAEVSDVANAVLDGTDAVMLSGETAAGNYPVETVKTMVSIIEEIEQSCLLTNFAKPEDVIKDESFSSAIAEAVTSAAREFNLSAIAVYSKSGRSARLVSAERPEANLVAFCWDDNVRKRLNLSWGIKPLKGNWVNGPAAVVSQVERELVSHGLVNHGDNIAVTFGLVLDDEPFQTNIMKLWKVREDLTLPLKNSY